MDNCMDEAKAIVESMEKEKKLSQIESMIRNNCVEFDYNNEKYRVRLLTNKEKEELQLLRIKKANSMSQEKDENGNYVYLTEKALIKIFKDRGDVDLDKNEEELKKLDAEENILQLKLGEEIANNASEEIFEELKKQIEEIRIKKTILNTQKALILESSFENTLLAYTAKVITYLSTDVMIDEKWERKWKTLEDFESEKEDNLITQAAQISMFLQYL